MFTFLHFMSIIVCELIWLHIIISVGEQINYLCISYRYSTKVYVRSWNCGNNKSYLEIIPDYLVLIKIN